MCDVDELLHDARKVGAAVPVIVHRNVFCYDMAASCLSSSSTFFFLVFFFLWPFFYCVPDDMRPFLFILPSIVSYRK
jgi:hypothetical protein